MTNYWKLSILSVLLIFVLGSTATATPFFYVHKVRLKTTPDPSSPVPKILQSDRTYVFHPYVEATIEVAAQIKSRDLTVKAYFYDEGATTDPIVVLPTAVSRPQGACAVPSILPSKKSLNVYFYVPESFQEKRGYPVLIVFGDSNEVATRFYPNGNIEDFTFPEKVIALNEGKSTVVRMPVIDPIVEYVVKTKSNHQKQITLFMRPPIGANDASQAKGVLALSILAGNVGEVRNKIQGIEKTDDLTGLLKFADENKLIIIGWGSSRLWNPLKNYSDQERKERMEMDAEFDDIADSWVKGVRYFIQQYKIPENDYLLKGVCGSAQWALRLALRKPEFFLGVHGHLASSYDRPTEGGKQVLWAITAGELDGGYPNSLNFYMQCREMAYPMIYKAIPGLGHAEHHLSDEVGLKFFKYCLSVKEQREMWREKLKQEPDNRELKENYPWTSAFANPPFYGDIVNQECYSSDQVELIPKGFRTPIPNQDIADSWKKWP